MDENIQENKIMNNEKIHIDVEEFTTVSKKTSIRKVTLNKNTITEKLDLNCAINNEIGNIKKEKELE